jgi:hypothetical protein
MSFCPLSVAGSHLEYHITSNQHVSLASSRLWQFFRLCFFWMTLTLAECLSICVCLMFSLWDCSYSLGGGRITEVKWHSHHIISKVHYQHDSSLRKLIFITLPILHTLLLGKKSWWQPTLKGLGVPISLIEKCIILVFVCCWSENNGEVSV